MEKTTLTTKELQTLYLNGENEKIIKELFGEDSKHFDFETYKSKSGWDNKGFNPLHQLIDLAEFLNAASEGHTVDSKAKMFKEVIDNFAA